MLDRRCIQQYENGANLRVVAARTRAALLAATFSPFPPCRTLNRGHN